MVQHGSSRGAVLINGFPETYYFNPFSNLSPAQQLQKFGQHPPAVLAPSSYSGQNVGRSPGDSGQVGSGRYPLPASSKICSQAVNARRCVQRLLSALDTDNRPSYGISSSHSAGPRFRHSGTILRLAEVWLCSDSSPSGSDGHKAGVARSRRRRKSILFGRSTMLSAAFQ